MADGNLELCACHSDCARAGYRLLTAIAGVRHFVILESISTARCAARNAFASCEAQKMVIRVITPDKKVARSDSDTAEYVLLKCESYGQVAVVASPQHETPAG